MRHTAAPELLVIRYGVPAPFVAPPFAQPLPSFRWGTAPGARVIGCLATRHEFDVFVRVVLHVELAIFRTHQKTALMLAPVISNKTRPIFPAANDHDNGRRMPAEDHPITNVDLLAVEVLQISVGHGHGSDVGSGTAYGTGGGAVAICTFFQKQSQLLGICCIWK